MKPEDKERVEGKIDETVGKVKKGVGRAIGSPGLEAEGAAEELQGHARHEAAEAAGRARGAAQQVAGKLKKAVGKAFGDKDLEAEGHVEDLEGKLRREANR
jgi:uncharacterized protein YjbJ (UPF0337 family)